MAYRRYTFHNDPGHAWLGVPEQDVKDVGYSPTPYSYQAGGKMYLEEDCDAPRFLELWEAAGNTYTLEEVYLDVPHWIRDLPRIEA